MMFQQNPFLHQNDVKSYVEFKAGKMMMTNGGWVESDDRRGIFSTYLTRDCSIHIQWRTRWSSQVEDHSTMYPGEAIFVRVQKCTTDRVYLLITRVGRKHFYWMQEPDAGTDKENVQKVNQLLRGRSCNPGDGAGSINSELEAMLKNLRLNQPELLSFITAGLRNESSSGSLQGNYDRYSLPRSSLTTSKSSESNPSRRICANGRKGRRTKQGPSGGSPPGSQDATKVSLENILNLENLDSIISVNHFLERTKPLLPNGSDKEEVNLQEELCAIIRSTHFKNAVKQMNDTIQSGESSQLTTLLFGFNKSISGTSSYERLLQLALALEAQEEKEKNKQNE